MPHFGSDERHRNHRRTNHRHDHRRSPIGSRATRPCSCRGTTVVALGSFLLGLAALSGGIRSVWIVLGIVFGAIAIGAAFVARWRIGAVRRDVPGIAADVRPLIAEGKEGTIDRDPRLPARRRRRPTTGSAIVLSRRMYDLRGVMGHGLVGFGPAHATPSPRSRRFPGLALTAIGISLVFGFLGVIFLLALASRDRAAVDPRRRPSPAALATAGLVAGAIAAGHTGRRQHRIRPLPRRSPASSVAAKRAPTASSSASRSPCRATTSTPATTTSGRSPTRIRPATGDRLGTFVTITGGPGSAGIASADDYTSYMSDQITEHYDLVFLNQRGSGDRRTRAPLRRGDRRVLRDRPRPADRDAIAAATAGVRRRVHGRGRDRRRRPAVFRHTPGGRRPRVRPSATSASTSSRCTARATAHSSCRPTPPPIPTMSPRCSSTAWST